MRAERTSTESADRHDGRQHVTIGDLERELETLRRAHEALSRRLVAERAAFADGIVRVQATVFNSRSWRYTAPMRAAIRVLRRFKP